MSAIWQWCEYVQHTSWAGKQKWRLKKKKKIPPGGHDCDATTAVDVSKQGGDGRQGSKVPGRLVRRTCLRCSYRRSAAAASDVAVVVVLTLTNRYNAVRGNVIGGDAFCFCFCLFFYCACRMSSGRGATYYCVFILSQARFFFWPSLILPVSCSYYLSGYAFFLSYITYHFSFLFSFVLFFVSLFFFFFFAFSFLFSFLFSFFFAFGFSLNVSGLLAGVCCARCTDDMCVLSSHQNVLSTQRYQYTQCPCWFFILEIWKFCGHRLWDREKPQQPQLILAR